jgi:hypothetical protein
MWGKQMNLLLLSLFMIAAGLIFYAAGHRKRRSLDVPLISDHTKIIIGGCLIIGGAGLVLLYWES